MKTIVVYTSRTGFTQQYAEFISYGLNCLEKADPFALKEFPLILYGGPVHGGDIEGLDTLRGMARGRVLVFAVGALPDTEVVRAKLRNANDIPEEDFFYLEGGMRYDELPPGTKRALRLYQHTLEMGNQDNLSPEQRFFLNNIGRTFDHMDRNAAEAVVAAAESLRTVSSET